MRSFGGNVLDTYIKGLSVFVGEVGVFLNFFP